MTMALNAILKSARYLNKDYNFRLAHIFFFDY